MQKSFLFFFNLMLVRYLHGLGISEIRYICFFVVPSGSGWEIAAVFALGRCRGRRTSQQDRRSTWATHCPWLWRPFAAGPASSLLVVGCRRCPWWDSYKVPDTRTCSWITLCICFVFSFFRLVLPTKYSRIACCYFCCSIFIISFFYACLSPPKWMRQGRMVVVLCQGSGAA